MPRLFLATLGALALSAVPAHAALQTTTTLTFNSAGTIVDNFRTVFGGVTGSASKPFINIYGGPDITPGTTLYGGTTTPDFFEDAYFFMGVTEALPGAARHLVLGINQDLSGQAFSDLFPDYTEQSLIDAIVGLNAGTVPYFGDEYKLVSGFQVRYQSQYAFNFSDMGYLTAFSTGTGYGTITTKTTVENVPDAVPEVSTWLMLVAGCGVAGVALRRRREPVPA